MKHYLVKEHIEILNSIINYIPKYDTFNLTELSKSLKEIENRFSDWAYLESKFPATYDNIFTSLWLNGFIEITDKVKGIARLTPDGHKLKDIGDYEKYLEYLHAEYRAKRAESSSKIYWWLALVIAFILGILGSNVVKSLSSEQISKSNHVAKYLYGIPPAPPFNDIKLTVSDSAMEDCDILQDYITGYIIEVYKDKTYIDNELLIQDENGVRDTYYIDESSVSNADRSYLPYILIPGNKVSMKVQSCGSGDFRYIMNITTLKRD